jgi:hypothetical protein
MTAAVWAEGEPRADAGAKCACRVFVLTALAWLCWMGQGCAPTPRMLSSGEQHTIDRAMVEYPADFELHRYITNLTAPTAMVFDQDGSLLVAQGARGEEPEIFSFARNGKMEVFYPRDRKWPFRFAVPGWRMYGPIGGMVVFQGEVYVSHRDENGFGVITALDHKGHHRTVVAGLPAQGDYGVTDLALDTSTDANHPRIFFGIGTATNSGVVGLDNWTAGWVLDHPRFHDQPWHDLFLRGYRFDSANPMGSIFGPADIAVTGPFQAFNQATQLRVPGAPSGKPGGAICSVLPGGGAVQIEGFGIHNPRGIAFDQFGQPFFTNGGMELRGTRPIMNDPDALLKLTTGQTWYGWPDYTASLDRVSEKKFQPPTDLIEKTGYPEGVRELVDERDSGLAAPVNETLLAASFAWMSGAAKLQFAPTKWPLRAVAGNAVVALSGDHAPFSTSGRQLVGPGGYRVVYVDVTRHMVQDLVRNTKLLPRSEQESHSFDLLERPVDPKFGPDGALYILDCGHMQIKDGKEHFDNGSGQIFRLVPPRQSPSSTRPGDSSGDQVLR